MAIFRVTLGSNQGSDHNTIFIYLISSFQEQNFKIWSRHSEKNSFFTYLEI